MPKRGTSVIEIREEDSADIDAVRDVNRHAFDQEQEGRIVDALRDAGAVTLALVAISGDVVVGHILFSPLTVGVEVGAALGPMAVMPAYQRQGIGSRLVAQGLERLRAEGCPFVVVIGHPEFYPRFGFEPAAALGLTCDWEVPAEAFMVNVLNAELGSRLQGRAQYRAEFSTIE
jgi:putative acetyltransferase